MTDHTCAHPLRHRLLMGGVILVWVTVLSLRVIPKLVVALTHSGAWGLVSIGLSLTVGTAIVKALAAWRCPPPATSHRGLSAMTHLAIAGFVLGREKP